MEEFRSTASSSDSKVWVGGSCPLSEGCRVSVLLTPDWTLGSSLPPCGSAWYLTHTLTTIMQDWLLHLWGRRNKLSKYHLRVSVIKDCWWGSEKDKASHHMNTSAIGVQTACCHAGGFWVQSCCCCCFPPENLTT